MSTSQHLDLTIIAVLGQESSGIPVGCVPPAFLVYVVKRGYFKITPLPLSGLFHIRPVNIGRLYCAQTGNTRVKTLHWGTPNFVKNYARSGNDSSLSLHSPNTCE